MIKLILQMLEFANGETEEIQRAQGKYLHPESFKGAWQKFKKELKWQRK
jgi:hypothetical protein